MKRFYAVLFAFVLMLCAYTNVYAGGNVTDIIEGRQDILLFAIVEDFSEETVILDPYGVMTSSGLDNNVLNDDISVDIFYYTYCSEHSDMPTKPMKGDNIVISLNRKGKGYVVANGAYKLSSMDQQLFTVLVSEKTKGQECLADIVMLVEYLHTDGEVNKFERKDNVVVAKVDDKIVKLYPTDKIMNYVSFVNSKGEVVEAIKTKDIVEGGTSDNKPYFVFFNNNKWVFAIAVILLSLFAGGIFSYRFAIRDVVIKRKRGQ